MIRTANPALRGFENPQRWDDLASGDGRTLDAPARVMTINGTVTATAILVGLCISTAVVAWTPLSGMANNGNFGGLIGISIGAALVGLLVFLGMSFVHKLSPFLAPVYAILQGVYVSGFSIFIAARWLGPSESGAAVNPEATGMIFQAVLLTFGVLAGLLMAYATGLVRIGGMMAKIMMCALGAVLLYMLALIVGNGFFNLGLPNLYADSSPLGIGFSLLLVGLASLFLILDFQFIEAGAQQRLPKYMEWYAGAGLLVTLVWLYIEILRLLAKLRGGD